MSGTRDPAQKAVAVDDDFVGKKTPFRLKDTSSGTGGGPPDSNVRRIPQFLPRGIIIGQHVNDLTASYTTVRMILWDEPDIDRHYKVYRLAVGIVHPLRPAAIDMSKSGGRDILVLA